MDNQFSHASRVRLPDLVSVFMVTYNHERFIEQAVESVYAQDVDFPVQLVIAEDKSTDATRAVARALAARAPAHVDVKLIEREPNMGAQANFLDGWEHCEGEYVALLEGDDFWTSPIKLRTQVHRLSKRPARTISFHRVDTLSADGTRRVNELIPSDDGPFTAGRLARGCFISTCSVVVRRDALPSLPAWVRDLPQADWPLFFLAATRGEIDFIDETWSTYRLHAGGIWASRPLWQQYELMTRFPSAALANLSLTRDLRSQFEICACHWYWIAAQEAWRSGDRGQAKRLATHVAPKLATSVPAWRGLASTVMANIRARRLSKSSGDSA